MICAWVGALQKLMWTQIFQTENIGVLTFKWIFGIALLNSFLANVPILYPLKTSENQRFSGGFRRYKMGTLARNGLITYLFVLITYLLLNPIQDGHFRGCSRIGGQKGLKSVTHILQWWNLAQLYLTSRRSKKYKNHVTHTLTSADISIFSSEISNFCYIKK